MSEDFPVQLAWFRPGSQVAGYRLEAQVGAGGMAVVFRARDERQGRPVALKILAPALASDPEFRRRFIAESRAAGAVDDVLRDAPARDVRERSGSVLLRALTAISAALAALHEELSMAIRPGPLHPPTPSS